MIYDVMFCARCIYILLILKVHHRLADLIEGGHLTNITGPFSPLTLCFSHVSYRTVARSNRFLQAEKALEYSRPSRVFFKKIQYV